MTAGRPRGPATLVVRMLVWSLLLLALGVPALWWTSHSAIRALSEEAADTQLRAFALQLRAAFVSAQAAAPPRIGVGDLEWVWQVDIDGTPAFRSELLDLTGTTLVSTLDRPTADFVVRFVDTPLGPMRLAERIVHERLSAERADAAMVRYLVGIDALRYAAIVEDQTRALQGLTLRITIPSLLLLVAVIVAMLVTLRRSLNSVGRALARFEAGETDAIAGRFPAELQRLVDRVNGLLARNARLLARTRKYVSKIAHDLNHPLAVLRNGLPGGEGARLLHGQVERMAGLIERYASLAQAVGTDAGVARSLPVAAVLEDVRDGYAILYRQPPVTISVECPADLVFSVPRHDLEAAIGNLTANAHRFAASRILLAARLDKGGLVVSVDDDGPGIPAEHRPSALRWGERLDQAPPGSGLGLAIVADLADLHGGTLELDDSPLGGLRAALRLPAAGTGG
ncbi:MAG: HAMP domain-containing histidine kinase [Inquilinus sp.]|nr:HAMP domain-containing histidine kinase [Inquilinus sp.]